MRLPLLPSLPYHCLRWRACAAQRPWWRSGRSAEMACLCASGPGPRRRREDRQPPFTSLTPDAIGEVGRAWTATSDDKI
jgi:hypothetical protein